MTSHTISPMSWRSPSVRVIGSKKVLGAFDLFYSPTYSLRHYRFSYVDVVCRSMPPSSRSISCVCEDDFAPSRSFSIALYCFYTAFATSRTSYTLAAATSFLLFSANCAICSFTSFFFLCAADFSDSTVELTGVCHSSGHDSSTANMASFVSR